MIKVNVPHVSKEDELTNDIVYAPHKLLQVPKPTTSQTLRGGLHKSVSANGAIGLCGFL